MDSFPRLLRPLVKSVIRRKRGMHGSTMTRALSNSATESHSCTSLDHEPRTIVVVACNDNKRRLEILPAKLTHTSLRKEKAATAQRYCACKPPFAIAAKRQSPIRIERAEQTSAVSTKWDAKTIFAWKRDKRTPTIGQYQSHPKACAARLSNI